MPTDRSHAAAARRQKLEDAAIRLFCQRGYCAVGLRDIAAEAGVSLGNIYNYFDKKEPLFAAVVDRLHAEFAGATEPLARFLSRARFPDDAEELGRTVKLMVTRHRTYLTLVYVNIAEFGGRHVRPHYQDLAARFRQVLAGRADAAADAASGAGFASWVDPGVALALLYMQFSSHFVIERLMGARGHLGLDDDAAVSTIARMFLLGVCPRPAHEEGSP